MIKEILTATLVCMSTMGAGQKETDNNADESVRLVPRVMSYQGYLTNAMGVPVDSKLDMTFTIYNDSSGGTAMWSETHTDVVVERGVFSVIIGEITPVPVNIFKDDSDAYLELTLEDFHTLVPRTRLTPAVYSCITTHLDTVVKVADQIDDNDWIRATPDSVLFTANRLGIARGGAGNMLYGNVYTQTNLGGYACTTGSALGGSAGYATILGGAQCVADSPYCVVVAGNHNRARGRETFVGGGAFNFADGILSAVCAGDRNTAGGSRSFVGGGIENSTNGICTFVGGGNSNEVNGHCDVIAGGLSNTSYNGSYAAICGGRQNQTDGHYAYIGGGYSNAVEGNHAVISGGCNNSVYSSFATVSGGRNNQAGGQYVSVGGGYANIAEYDYAAISGGYVNTVTGKYGFVGGGRSNEAGTEGRDSCSVVTGGYNNTITSPFTFIGGGINNTASGYRSVIGGGSNNSVGWESGTIAGGSYNSSDGEYAVISGGRANRTDGDYSAIPGGYADTLTPNADYSMAFGRSVYSNMSYHYVIFNGDGPGKVSINRDYHDGSNLRPLQIGTSTSNGNNAYVTNGGVWTNGTGYKDSKEYRAIDGADVLKKIQDMVIAQWGYRDRTEAHISPTAEDFFRAFQCGTGNLADDSTHISAIDVAGVALLAIQELTTIIEEQQEKIEDQNERIKKLEQYIE